jgi:hypothetical protein
MREQLSEKGDIRLGVIKRVGSKSAQTGFNYDIIPSCYYWMACTANL